MLALQLPAIVYIVESDGDRRQWLIDVVQELGFGFQAFSSAEKLLEADELARPACIVLDITLRGKSGLKLLDRLQQRHEVAPPAVVFAARADAATVVQAMRSGAIDFLEKPLSIEAMHNSIRQALELDAVRKQRYDELQKLRSCYDTLSEDERAVLALMLRGRSNKEIAAQVDVSVRTVQFRRASIMRKMEAECLADLARRVLRIELSTDII